MKVEFTNARVLPALIAIIFLFSVGNYCVNGLYAGLKFKGQDFVGYYANGKMLVQGVNLHDAEERQEALLKLELTRDSELLERATRSDYPPFWYLIMSSFRSLSRQNAFILWTGLNQIFLILVILLLFQYFDIKLKSAEALLVSFIVLNFYPLYYTLMEGQVNIFLLLLIILALWLFKKEMDWAAGLILGLATGIKIVPVFILLYFLWKGHWKVVAFGILGFLSTLLITTWGANGEIVVSYYTEQIFKYGASPNPDIFNQSINGFWSRLFTKSVFAEGWIESPQTANILIRLSSLTALILSMVFTRGKFERGGLNWNLGLAIFILTMMLVSAWTMEHHFINLYIPWIVVLIGFFRSYGISKTAATISILCFVIAAFNIPYTSVKFNSGIFILVKSLKFYILLIMWIVLLREAKRLRPKII